MTPPRELVRGERLARLPGDQINAGVRAYKRVFREPLRRLADDSGGDGGGGGAPAGTLVRVYDSIDKTNAVRCLPVSAADETVGDTTAEFLSVKPWDVSAKFAIDASGCCDDGGGPAPSGVRIDVPAIESGEVTCSGDGATEFATLTLTITDGTTSLTPAVTNNGDGTWDAAAQSLSTLSDGLVKLTVSDGSTEQSVGVVWITSPPAGTVPQTPDKPDLQADSDTGASSTDNRTSNTTPTFDATSKDVPDTTGPVPALIVDGELNTTGDSTSFDSSLTIGLTATALTENRHTAQLVYFFDNSPTPSAAFANLANDLYSVASDKLEFTVSPDATGSESSVRVNRAGVVETLTVAGTTEQRLVAVSACSKENTADENAKLDGV